MKSCCLLTASNNFFKSLSDNLDIGELPFDSVDSDSISSSSDDSPSLNSTPSPELLSPGSESPNPFLSNISEMSSSFFTITSELIILYTSIANIKTSVVLVNR